MPPSARPAASAAVDDGPLRRLRLLVIDDDEFVTRFLSDRLPAHGFDVTVVSTADNGIRLARLGAADAILLDLRLKDRENRTGLDVLRTIRSEGVATPVAVLTAYPDPESMALAAHLGAVYWAKPIGLEELVSGLKRLARVPTTLRSSPLAHGPSAGSEVSVERARGPNRLLDGAPGILKELGSCVRQAQPDPTRWPEARNRVIRILIRGLLDPTISVPVFLSCAHGVDEIQRTPREAFLDTVRQRTLRLERVARPQRPLEPQVAVIVEHLQQAGPDCGKLRRDHAARDAGMTPTKLSKHLSARTGYGFRAWRLGIRLQIAVRALAGTDHQIKYIADIAGFAGPTGGTTQFDRCFREVFGLTPRRFRSLLDDLRLR